MAVGRLADEHAEQAEALERQNRSLNRELEIREASAAASRAEVSPRKEKVSFIECVPMYCGAGGVGGST